MSIRQMCVDILFQIIEEKTFFNSLKNQIHDNDKAFANMLVLKTLRHLSPIKRIINSFLRKPLPEKQKKLAFVLYAATTELLLLETPDYAVLNEYVGISKKISNRFAAGMVNAVLRQITKNKDRLQKEIMQNLMPEEFKKILQKDYDTATIKKFENAILQQPPLDLSIKENPEQWAEKLGGTLFSNGTVRLNEHQNKISTIEGYNEGKWWIQDLAASLCVHLLGNVKDQNILDLCAAPGGKTAQLLAAGAKVTAVDIDPSRLERLKENMDRLQLASNLKIENADGLDFLKNDDHVYDAIVLDVPCSATGTFRRHPEVLHIKNQKDIEKQLKIQKELLKKATQRIKKGGQILYCTCSAAKAEGEKQIEDFLRKHSDFELILQDTSCLNLYQGINFDKGLFDKGVLRTFPYDMKEQGGMDAFFAACLKKVK